MKVICSNCNEAIEFADKRPAFCGHCGHSLAQANIHEVATLAYPAGASTAPSGDFTMGGEVPRVVGRYRLGRQLGQGGMGVVYEAEHEESGRRVALKLLTPGMAQSQESMDRFLREGRLAAALSHSRSTFVYEAGAHAGQPYIAMELMPGRTLQHVCSEEGALPVNRAVDFILDVIDGLEAAHAVGVIHRDVKPSNCFLDDSGRVKVGDFGLSKSLVTDASLTRTGAFMGTPLFAAPEQVRAGRVDERTDIYAVGATLFFLIAGRGPFVGDPAAVIAQISSDHAPSLRSLVPSVPGALDAIIARTLEKEPARRFSDLAQLRQSLMPFASGGVSIADVGRRLGAYMVDTMACGLAVGIGTAITTVVLTGVTTFGSVQMFGQNPTRDLLISFVAWSMQVGYFTVTEGIWGRALGKWLLGLRVVGITGEPPGVRRMLLRALFIPGGLGFTCLITFLATQAQRQAVSSDRDHMLANLGVTAMGLMSYVPLLLCLVTMRKRNGYRGVHELASGTRVVRLRRTWEEARLRDVSVVAPVAITQGARSFGPFREIGIVGQSGNTSVRIARDDILHRPVWVYVGCEPSAEYAGERIAVARPTRARWLQGGQSGGLRWDAFEAIVGAPIAEAVATSEGLSWERGRLVLLDLAEELRAATMDGTIPSSLSLDQIWLDRSGRVKLLDYPIQPCAASSSQHGGADHVPGAKSNPAVMGAVDLLRATADLCTRGQVLPGHVQEFLRLLDARPNTPETMQWTVDQLRELSERSAAIRWDDRLGILGVIMATEYSFYWTVGLAIGLLSWGLTEDVTWRLLPPFMFDLLGPFLLGFWFRGGPAFWFLGIEVRRSNGQPASRLRCALRNLVAWLPLIAFNGALPFFMNMSPRGYKAENLSPSDLALMMLSCSGSCIMFFAFLGVGYSLLRPHRGLQDILAGTYLVPR